MFDQVMPRIAARFGRVEPRAVARAYLHGQPSGDVAAVYRFDHVVCSTQGTTGASSTPNEVEDYYLRVRQRGRAAEVSGLLVLVAGAAGPPASTAPAAIAARRTPRLLVVVTGRAAPR